MLYREDKSCMNWGTANEIQELLAQPEQEPVAWMWTNEELGGTYFSDIETHNWIPLYTAPPKQEDDNSTGWWVKAQEPVAWMYEWYENDLESTQAYCGSEKPFQEDEVKPFNFRPLYLAPPKRKPLTPRQGLEEYKRGYARAELDLKREPIDTRRLGDTMSDATNNGLRAEIARLRGTNDRLESDLMLAKTALAETMKLFNNQPNDSGLRDHFAGLAMQGMTDPQPKFYCGDDIDSVAELAYKQADVMLAEREKNEN